MTNKLSKVRLSANGEFCQVRIPGICTHDPATTIWSHYRGQAGGKGMGHKSDDLCGAYACTSCDAVYDGHRPPPEGWTRQDVDLAWFEGHIRSLVVAKRKGVI